MKLPFFVKRANPGKSGVNPAILRFLNHTPFATIGYNL